MNSSKTLRKTGILYTVITVFTNAVINITLSITPSPVIDQDTVSKWLKFINDSIENDISKIVNAYNLVMSRSTFIQNLIIFNNI